MNFDGAEHHVGIAHPDALAGLLVPPAGGFHKCGPIRIGNLDRVLKEVLDELVLIRVHATLCVRHAVSPSASRSHALA